MTSGINYQKTHIVKLLERLSDLTGRTYKVEELENGQKKLIDEHSLFSGYIIANSWKDIRFMLLDIVNMMELSNQWMRRDQ